VVARSWESSRWPASGAHGLAAVAEIGVAATTPY